MLISLKAICCSFNFAACFQKIIVFAKLLCNRFLYLERYLSMYFLVSCNCICWCVSNVFSGVLQKYLLVCFKNICWCLAKIFVGVLQKYLRCSSLATTLRRRLPISCLLALSSTTPHICIHYPAKEASVVLLAHSSTVSKYDAH